MAIPRAKVPTAAPNAQTVRIQLPEYANRPARGTPQLAEAPTQRARVPQPQAQPQLMPAQPRPRQPSPAPARMMPPPSHAVPMPSHAVPMPSHAVPMPTHAVPPPFPERFAPEHTPPRAQRPLSQPQPQAQSQPQLQAQPQPRPRPQPQPQPQPQTAAPQWPQHSQPLPQPQHSQPLPQHEHPQRPVRAAFPLAAATTEPGDAAAVFDLTRRIALQRDLASAVGVIDLGVAEIAAASVAVAIVGSDAAIWSPRAADLRAAATVVQLDVVARIARGREPAVTPRAIVIPCDAGAPDGSAVAIIAHRPPTAPAFEARDAMVVAAVAAQIAPVLRGFLVDHANRSARDAADRGGLFRAEALKEARRGDKDGKPIFLTANWLKWAYPTILGLVVILFAAAALIQVPSYSTGSAIVKIDAEKITCPTGGTVAKVTVTPGQTVAKGDVLIELHATSEEADLDRVDAEYRVALSSFLFDPSDGGARGALSTIAATRQRALAAIDDRVIRATRGGVVNDVRVQQGELLLPGAPVLSIVEPDAEPSIVAFLPGSDRPRLKPGMTLQLRLTGFSRSNETATITDVGTEVIGPTAARKYLGETVGDTLPLHSSVVIVHAKLSGRTFAADDNTYDYHDGMTALGEVRLESKSFLRTLVAKE